MTYYFDNCATSRADDDVIAILDKYQRETYYNPSARSSFSLAVARELKSARESIAKTMGVTADEIYFTSGGTESDNIAIFGSGKSKKLHQIFVTPLQNGLLQRNYRHTAFALAVCAKAKFLDVWVMSEVIVKSRAKSACAHSVNNPHL